MTDTTVEPPEHRACRMNGDPDRDEQLRTEGRREANSAIDWGTSCVGCAKRLDQLYAERMAGYEEAARLIAEEIRTAYDRSGDRALLEALGYAVKHAGTGTEWPVAASEPSSRGPVGLGLSTGF